MCEQALEMRAEIERLEAALRKHHTGIGCVNYCRTCAAHFSWEKPEIAPSFAGPVHEG
jgi:hypothetical protein